MGHVAFARPRKVGWQLPLAAIESRSAVLIAVIVELLGYLSAFFCYCYYFCCLALPRPQLGVATDWEHFQLKNISCCLTLDVLRHAAACRQHEMEMAKKEKRKSTKLK